MQDYTREEQEIKHIVSGLSTDGKAKVLSFALRLRREEAQKGDEKTKGTK